MANNLYTKNRQAVCWGSFKNVKWKSVKYKERPPCKPYNKYRDSKKRIKKYCIRNNDIPTKGSEINKIAMEWF